MTPSKILFYFCIAFIAGIALNSIIKIPQIFLWGFLLLGIFSIIVSFFYSDHSDVIRKFGSLLGFCLFFLVLGIARIQASEFTIAQDALVKLNDSPEKINDAVIREFRPWLNFPHSSPRPAQFDSYTLHTLHTLEPA